MWETGKNRHDLEASTPGEQESCRLDFLWADQHEGLVEALHNFCLQLANTQDSAQLLAEESIDGGEAHEGTG